jgi:hypothetical protein
MKMKRCLDCGKELPNYYDKCKYCDSTRLESITTIKPDTPSGTAATPSLKENYPHLYTFVSFMRLEPDGDGGYEAGEADKYLSAYGREYALLTLKEAKAILPNIEPYCSEISKLANGYYLGEYWLSEQIRKLKIFI